MIGQVLGNRYELEELIGQGGMALVYRGRDRVLGRPVAVKVLREEYSNDTAFVARFQREARAAANLVHPNVVAVYDVGKDGDLYYIVMEYIAGPTLKEVIREQAPLSVDLALRVAEEVCAALEYAHRQGVIHRDIKPQNILLSEDGEVVKVADFGIAKSRLDPDTTTERLAMGTVKYISPEQAQGIEVVPQSDLYSLGVVLYEMLTGQQPFDGETPVSIALQHAEAAPVLPRRLNPYLPPPVEQIILRALSKRPQDRFTSAREMRLALSRYRMAGVEATGLVPQPIGQQEAPVRTPAPVPRRVPPPPRGRGLGPLGVLLLVLIVVGVVGLAWLAGRYLLPTVGPTPTETPTAPVAGVTVTPTPPEEVLVPDLTDLSAEEARTRLTEAGLEYAEGRPRFDPYTEPGKVVSQDPPYGETVPQGTVVTVVLAARPGLARVPNVREMSYPAAKLKLEQTGFRVARAEASCSSLPEDFVDHQEPQGGREEIQGITVTLYVSIGDQAVLPELLRVPLEEAQRRVEAAGLTWGFPNPQTQEDMPPGVDIDDLGAPGQVISYQVHYDGVRRTSGELEPGDLIPCGATVYVAYYATSP